MQLQVSNVVEEVQLCVRVREAVQVREQGRERPRHLPQQLHMLLCQEQ